MRSIKCYSSLLLAIFCLWGLPEAGAQAFCALRNPVLSIHRFFPESTGYHSVVRSITKETRIAVEKAIPFRLHFRELGRHTLYLVERKGEPIGLIHVRSETGEWGLVEIVWALNPDLTIRDFRFQRCRDRNGKKLEADAFKSQLTGKEIQELTKFFNKDSSIPLAEVMNISKGAEKLAFTVLRSAIKTIQITSTAWKNEIEQIQKQSSLLP
jgi:hypothetical protein